MLERWQKNKKTNDLSQVQTISPRLNGVNQGAIHGYSATRSLENGDAGLWACDFGGGLFA